MIIEHLARQKAKRKHERNDEPALFPVAPAFFSPIFFIIKLEPMKMLEETARTNPVMLSEDAPICHNQTNDIKKYLLMKLTKESQGQDVQFDPLTL